MTEETQITNEETISRGDRALEVVSQLLELSNIGAQVDVEEGEDRIRIEVVPENEADVDLLVGRQGHTLSAFQYIANRIVNRFPENRKPIGIDVSGYIAQHRTKLESFAQRVQDKLVDNDVEISIVGMSPGDRRTLHLALSESNKVRTFSQNEGIARRIVVTPKR